MNIYNRVRNYRFLKKVLSGKEKLARKDRSLNLIDTLFRVYSKSKKKSCDRNLAAGVVRKIRNKYPYEVKGWAEAEKQYKEYFNLDRAIKSFSDLKEGDYITLYTDTYAGKGYKEFEYWIGNIYDARVGTTFKLGECRKDYGYFYISEGGDVIGIDDITAYLYSTKEEIEVYEAEERRKNKIKDKIEKLNEEVAKLYKEL